MIIPLTTRTMGEQASDMNSMECWDYIMDIIFYNSQVAILIIACQKEYL